MIDAIVAPTVRKRRRVGRGSSSRMKSCRVAYRSPGRFSRHRRRTRVNLRPVPRNLTFPVQWPENTSRGQAAGKGGSPATISYRTAPSE